MSKNSTASTATETRVEMSAVLLGGSVKGLASLIGTIIGVAMGAIARLKTRTAANALP